MHTPRTQLPVPIIAGFHFKSIHPPRGHGRQRSLSAYVSLSLSVLSLSLSDSSPTHPHRLRRAPKLRPAPPTATPLPTAEPKFPPRPPLMQLLLLLRGSLLCRSAAGTWRGCESSTCGAGGRLRLLQQAASLRATSRAVSAAAETPPPCKRPASLSDTTQKQRVRGSKGGMVGGVAVKES